MLGYTIDNELTGKIFSTDGASASRGELHTSYIPCNSQGGPPDEELEVDDPSELLGKEIYFKVMILDAKGLPAELQKEVYVTYCFKHEPGVVYRSPS